jgi:hypothetical protein
MIISRDVSQNEQHVTWTDGRDFIVVPSYAWIWLGDPEASALLRGLWKQQRIRKLSGNYPADGSVAHSGKMQVHD